MPTTDNYNWYTDSSNLVIDTTDSNFHREGTYFILVVPAFSAWDFFRGMYWTYIISYNTETQYIYLQSKMTSEIKQGVRSTNYYRHFISDLSDELSLAMTIYSGDPQMYIGLDPKKKWPGKNNSDY